MSDQDAVEGYLDGRDLDAPWPGDNRSHIYRHCFEVGRREAVGEHWTAPEARIRARVAEIKDASLMPSAQS